ISRIQSELGGMREYRSSSFEEVLEQVVIDLQEEFESYSRSRSRAGPRGRALLDERPHALLLVLRRADDAERGGLEVESRGEGHLHRGPQAGLREGDGRRALSQDLPGHGLGLLEQPVGGYAAVR